MNESTIGFILGILGMVVIAPFAMRSFNQQRKELSTRRRERKRNQ
jgi:hypothetical protein